jgi:hypothetical protein
VHLLTTDYIKPDFVTGSYTTLVYLVPGPLALTYTRLQSKEAVERLTTGRIEYTFAAEPEKVKKGRKTKASTSKDATSESRPKPSRRKRKQEPEIVEADDEMDDIELIDGTDDEQEDAGRDSPPSKRARRNPVSESNFFDQDEPFEDEFDDDIMEQDPWSFSLRPRAGGSTLKENDDGVIELSD